MELLFVIYTVLYPLHIVFRDNKTQLTVDKKDQTYCTDRDNANTTETCSQQVVVLLHILTVCYEWYAMLSDGVQYCLMVCNIV